MFRLFVCVLVVGGVGCSTASRSDEADAQGVGEGGPDAALAADAQTSARTIKVLTMNLKTALPSDSTYAARTQIVADFINAHKPDVVALQEITESSSMTNRGQALAQATGYTLTWKKTHELFVGNEGVGILAKGTLAWQGTEELPHTELGLLHRAVVGARVMTSSGPIELYATHFTVAGSVSDRADQAAEALAFATTNHQANVPAFIAGDLNATPSELSMQNLTAAGLVDAWPAAASTVGNGYTIPSDAPDRRIDYIYMLPGSGTVTSCETVLATPVNGVRASDHLGVLCTFSF